jgi:hypothetical protein
MEKFNIKKRKSKFINDMQKEWIKKDEMFFVDKSIVVYVNNGCVCLH